MSKSSHHFQDSGAKEFEQARTKFATPEPNAEDYVLERWLALAEAVLRKRDAQADKPQEDETAPPN